jgi:hypothetical protein
MGTVTGTGGRSGIPAFVLLAVLGAGCNSPPTGPNMVGVPFPVLVGPVERIGGGSGGLGRKVQTVEAEASFSVVASSSTQDYGSYRVQTTTTETFALDSAASTIVGASGGIPGPVAKMRDLKAVQHYHVSLAGLTSRYVWVECDLHSSEGRRTGPAGAAPKEARP